MNIFHKTVIPALFSSLLLSSNAFADGDEDHDDDKGICNGAASPILSVADFDGNGIVNEDDIVLIKKAKEKEIYYAFYDINADGEVDREDIQTAQSDLGKNSTLVDRQLAKLFHYTKQYQLVDSTQEIAAMDFTKVAEALSGHGEHWSDFNAAPIPQFLNPNGLNVAASDQKIKGMFWAADAIPVFEYGANDYPTPGGEWMNQRVIKFSGHPPKFTASPDEKWHTHAGLCFTVEMGATSPQLVLNQHTTFAQCQEIPTLVKTAGEYNFWDNIWMLHAWMFDLNPNGFFANTHPCVDPEAPLEETINGGREIPEFFQGHHG